MPYIKNDRKMEFEGTGSVPQNAGELNYCFTKVIISYVENHELSYQTINDIIGAIDSAKMEFYRRTVVPYENKKILENGDVYPNGK